MNQTTIETDRLVICPFRIGNLETIHSILDRAFGAGDKVNEPSALEIRRSWLEWSTLNQVWFPRLHQPPYGDRAITLKKGGILIGSIGYVPLLDAFEQIPELSPPGGDSGLNTPEFGLFWAVDPDYQGQGYATEAARGMIEYAFSVLNLKRILATTEHDNTASQAVMRKLGMTITHNPKPEPPWLQVVGVLENKS